MKNIIMGQFNGQKEIFYWIYNEGDTKGVEIGNYAIVENKNGYDLVKIVGFGKVKDDLKIAHKRVICFIEMCDIENQ